MCRLGVSACWLVVTQISKSDGIWHGVCLVVANGASMQMVEGSIPTAPRSSYNGSCSDHGLKGNLVEVYRLMLAHVISV
jgi:hypothetical protein